MGQGSTGQTVSQPWRCTVTTCARTRYAVLTIGEAAAYLGLTKSTGVELNLDADRARSAWFQWLLDKARDDAKQARQPDET